SKPPRRRRSRSPHLPRRPTTADRHGRCGWRRWRRSPAVSSPRAGVHEPPRLINAAHPAGAPGVGEPDEPRVYPQTVAGLPQAGELLVIERDGELAGCVRVGELDEETGELGLLSAARDGSGVGRELIAKAEDWARARGKRRMRLQLLVPKQGEHPFKVRLDGWYQRLGYRPTGREDFPHAGLAI